MKYLLSLLILLNYQMIQGVLEWTVTGKATYYGQNVTLFCNVSNCCPYYSGWDMWNPARRTLVIDVKTGKPNKKYDWKALGNGYTLIIQALTEKDLNVSYSCVYGAKLGERKLLVEEDVFTDTTPTQQDLPTEHTEDDRLTGSEIFGIIVGVVVFAASVSSVVPFIYGRRKKRKGTGNRNGNRAGLDEHVPFMELETKIMHKFAELEKKFMRKIAELEKKFMHQLPHEIKAKCNTGDTTSASDRIGYDDLKRERGEYRCEEHDSNHSNDDIENTWLKHVPDLFQGIEDDPESLPITCIRSKTKTVSTKFTKEEINFAKMQITVMNILADVLYDLLKQDKPNLHPMRDCDISYLYIELRKLNKHVPSNSWGGSWNTIQSTNINIGDDIERIRLTRNELQHSRDFHLADHRFYQLRDIVSDLLKRFDRYNMSARKYTDELNAVMNKCLSSEDVSRGIRNAGIGMSEYDIRM